MPAQRHKPTRNSELSLPLRRKLRNALQTASDGSTGGSGSSGTNVYGFAFSRSVASITPLAAIVGFDQGLTWKIPNGNPSGRARVTGAPTSDTTFDIRFNGASIGSLVFLSGSTDGTWSIPSDVVVNEEVTVLAPATLNGMSGLLRFSIIGELV